MDGAGATEEARLRDQMKLLMQQYMSSESGCAEDEGADESSEEATGWSTVNNLLSKYSTSDTTRETAPPSTSSIAVTPLLDSANETSLETSEDQELKQDSVFREQMGNTGPPTAMAKHMVSLFSGQALVNQGDLASIDKYQGNITTKMKYLTGLLKEQNAASERQFFEARSDLEEFVELLQTMKKDMGFIDRKMEIIKTKLPSSEATNEKITMAKPATSSNWQIL